MNYSLFTSGHDQKTGDIIEKLFHELKNFDFCSDANKWRHYSKKRSGKFRKNKKLLRILKKFMKANKFTKNQDFTEKKKVKVLTEEEEIERVKRLAGRERIAYYKALKKKKLAEIIDVKEQDF
jgi:hypothetical protein